MSHWSGLYSQRLKAALLMVAGSMASTDSQNVYLGVDWFVGLWTDELRWSSLLLIYTYLETETSQTIYWGCSTLGILEISILLNNNNFLVPRCITTKACAYSLQHVNFLNLQTATQCLSFLYSTSLEQSTFNTFEIDYPVCGCNSSPWFLHFPQATWL